jgi:hypothetical protein
VVHPLWWPTEGGYGRFTSRQQRGKRTLESVWFVIEILWRDPIYTSTFV